MAAGVAMTGRRGLAAAALMLLLLGDAAALRAERAFVPYQPPSLPPNEAAAIAAHGFAPDDVGFLVHDLESGEVLAARNAGEAFIPASVTKVATAIAALENLGGAHRFTTRVAAVGTAENGVLDGDLVLIGGGDPGLGADDLLALCHELRASGIREISGRLLYDDGLYFRHPAIESRQPLDAGYNPGVSALSLDFNRVQLRWQSNSGGGALSGYSVPPLPGLALDVAAQHAGGDQIWQPEQNGNGTLWRLSPRAPEGGASWLPVREPASAAAQIFQRICAQAGVRLPAPEAGESADYAGANAWNAARQDSQPLSEVVRGMLAYSNNLVAELVGLAAARSLTQQAQSLPESAKELARWWRARMPGTDWSEYVTLNHSGLSPDARATPSQFVAMLSAVDGRFYGSEGQRRSLESLLPAAGLHGSLSGRLANPATGLKVWAKTGTVNYASGLAGYLHSEGGKRLAFALFVNDKAARKAYDEDPERRGARMRAEAAGWRGRAKALEDVLVESWARRW